MKKILSKLLVFFMLFSSISSSIQIDVQAATDIISKSSINNYDETVEKTSSDENDESFRECDRLGVDNLGVDNLPTELPKQYSAYSIPKNAPSSESLANYTNIRPIVIFIKFSDDTTEYFTEARRNEIKEGLIGSGFSVKTYVDLISYNKCSVDPIFTYDKNLCIYTPKHKSGYYKKYKEGTNEEGYKTDSEKIARRDELFNGAFRECTQGIDFSDVDLDRDGDGNIDTVLFFNSSSDDYAEVLYSEKWAIWNDQPTIVDKSGEEKKVYEYINIDKDSLNGWGRRVLTHEFSHSLGFPDMYPYGKVKSGLENACGHYTMMCDNAGYPTVLERINYGNWISDEDVDMINDEGCYNIYDVTSNPKNYSIAYKIEIPNSDEYFMVEYRNKDANVVENLIPESGILVYRVDPSRSGSGNTGYEPEIYVMRNSRQTADEGVLTGKTGRKSVKLLLKSGEDTGYSVEYVTHKGNYAQFKLVCNTGVRYSTIIQGNSSFEEFSCDGELSGTKGQGKRIDGFKMDTYAPNDSIRYRAYIRNVGWTDWLSSNEELKGNGNDIENIQIKLNGPVSSRYSVYYRTYNRNYGWLGWTSNGESSGTYNYGSAIEGIQVRAIKKGTSVSGITDDTKSAYKENTTKYTVTFKDYNGTVLKTETVSYGSSATAPSNPTRTGYTFAGWNKAFDYICKDTVVTAKYNKNKYTVTFKNYDGTVLKTETVSYKSSATAPSNPTRTGYTFVGWDKSYINIKEDTVVTATFEKSQVTIYYKGYDAPYIHYKVGNGSWTKAPGVKMSSNSDVDGYNYAISIELGSASKITACFNDGNGSWDNNGKKNYSFKAGYYTFKNGVITKIDEPTKKLSITSLTTNYSKGVTGLRPVIISTEVQNAQGIVKYTYTDTAADGTTQIIKTNTTDSKITWTPLSYGNHVIKVIATDGVTTVTKTIDFVVNICAKVTLSGPSEIAVGKNTIFIMNATGGTGNLTYNFYYTKSLSDNKVLIQSSNNNTLIWKPSEEGTYQLWYSISDEGGDVDHEFGYKQVTVEEKVAAKTVIYYKGYSTPYIHYKIGNGSWTKASGVKMDSSNDLDGYTHMIEIDLVDADNITACFNNGNGSWDNNNGKNYTFGEGYYTFANGKINRIDKTSNEITIYYKGYDNPYIHYKIGNESWTKSPGIAMTKTSEKSGYTHKVIIDLGDEDNITACFNNGNGSWDSNNGNNYYFNGVGTYTYSSGKINKIS